MSEIGAMRRMLDDWADGRLCAGVALWRVRRGPGLEVFMQVSFVDGEVLFAAHALGREVYQEWIPTKALTPDILQSHLEAMRVSVQVEARKLAEAIDAL